MDGIDEFISDLNQGVHYAGFASSTNILAYTKGTWNKSRPHAGAFDHSALVAEGRPTTSRVHGQRWLCSRLPHRGPASA